MNEKLARPVASIVGSELYADANRAGISELLGVVSIVRGMPPETPLPSCVLSRCCLYRDIASLSWQWHVCGERGANHTRLHNSRIVDRETPGLDIQERRRFLWSSEKILRSRIAVGKERCTDCEVRSAAGSIKDKIWRIRNRPCGIWLMIVSDDRPDILAVVVSHREAIYIKQYWRVDRVWHVTTISTSAFYRRFCYNYYRKMKMMRTKSVSLLSGTLSFAESDRECDERIGSTRTRSMI